MATDFGASTASRSGANVAWRRGRGRSRREDHQRVGGHRVRASDEQRIDVDLGDLRVVGGDLRDGLDDGDQRGAVDGRLAAERAEQRLALDQIGELRDIALGAGGDGEGDVAEHLGHGPAEAEGHHGTEGRVALHADHELAAAGDHLLDEHGLEGVAGALRERGVGRGDLFRRAQLEDDELELGLVLDERADRLHRDRARRATPPGRRPQPRSARCRRPGPARRRRPGPAWRRLRRAPGRPAASAFSTISLVAARASWTSACIATPSPDQRTSHAAHLQLYRW